MASRVQRPLVTSPRQSTGPHPASPPPRPRPAGAVATLLTPAERQRVDAAGEGCYVALHRETLDDVLRDVQHQRAHAVLVSVARYDDRAGVQMARLVREYPRVPAVALLSGAEARTTQVLLSLGQHGVRALVDVRDPRGWHELRHLLVEHRRSSIERRALAQLAADLPDAPPDCHRFFEALFLAPAHVTTVRQLARRLGVVPSTLMSRFFRAQLPAPKRYLAMARLTRAARLFENAGLSISQVALRLEFSSPQSFSRHVRAVLHCTPVEFRRRHDGEAMIGRFRAELIHPYREILRHFHPFEMPPHWQARRPPQASADLPAELPADRGAAADEALHPDALTRITRGEPC